MSKRIRYKNYSIIADLKKQNKIDDEFLINLNLLSLEELIAAKLESTFKSFNGRLYGLPLYRTMPKLTRNAVLQAAISVCSTYREMAAFLGMDYLNFYHRVIQKDFVITSFFKKYIVKDEKLEELLQVAKRKEKSQMKFL